MAEEFWYPGATYPMEPGYSQPFTGYRAPAGTIGLTTDPNTANQIQDVSRRLNLGGKAIEVNQVLSQAVFESIPDQHLDEIRRLSKLVNADITFHAPLVEPSGFSNGRWSEANRELVERQMVETINRAKKMSKDGNMPITFHSSGDVKGSLPEALVREKEGKGEKVKEMIIIDPVSGDIQTITQKPEYFPEAEKGAEFNPKQELDRRNKELWLAKMNQLSLHASKGKDILNQINDGMEVAGAGMDDENKEKLKQTLLNLYQTGKEMDTEEVKRWKEKKADVFVGIVNNIKRNFNHASINLMDSYNTLKEFYNRVYKQIQETAEKGEGKEKETAKKDMEALNKYASEIGPMVQNKVYEDQNKIYDFAEVVEKGFEVMKNINPKVYRPLNDFLVENSGKTFGNAAWQTYLKAKPEERNKLPIISIENPPAGGALSRAEDLKNVIKSARDQFVAEAITKGKMSKSEAEKIAEKMIGATWDVGHINMIRKYGYDKNDIIKETETIKPYLKHMHLSDNFGMEHTELPMGMGNVPIKEIIEKLGKQGVESKKVIEALDWYRHFKAPALQKTFAAMGSPVYGGGASPYWSQAPGSGSYGMGYGNIFPEQHVSMYGGGFSMSSLPMELGGQKQQKGGFSGAPME